MGLRDFVGIIRELSLNDIRLEATTAPRILVLAVNRETAAALSDSLFGRDASQFVEAFPFAGSDVDPLHYDVIVCLGPLPKQTGRDWRKLFDRAGEELRLVEVSLDRIAAPHNLDSIRRRIADAADERALSIGRYMPSMRGAAAHQVVRETSMVNAQFALVSNIPAVVPVVGNLVAVGADFFVLTKNQLLMIYKLAAINGRDLDHRWRIYSEMLPVVGAGLVWRTVAREIAALLPLAAGTVPKVAIAFAGTFATGQAAELYYENGERLSGEQLRSLYAEGLALLRRQPFSLPSKRLGVDDAQREASIVNVSAEA